MMMKPVQIVTALAASLVLAGCISLSQDPPESLLTLTSSASAPAGSGASAGPDGADNAIAVMTPEVPAKLDVNRVPVQVSDTNLAYLQEAVWVERPARLFRRLLGETLRTRGSELVLDTDDTPTSDVAAAKEIIRVLFRKLAALGPVDWPAHNALGGGMAVMTRPDLIPEDTRERLDLLVGKYLWPKE